MWELVQLAQLLETAAVLTILVLCSGVLVEYVRLRRGVIRLLQRTARKMDCDELIDQLLSLDDTKKESPTRSEGTTAQTVPAAPAAEPAVPSAAPLERVERQEQKRARLAAIVAGGTAQKYLGKQLTLAQVDELTDDKVSKHYGRYEARLGASMTKILGASALQMYALVAGTFLPIPPENRPQLVSDLGEDPFVEHALMTACCELYHRYGMYLAPLTAAMTTAKHCQFGDAGSVVCEANRKDGSIRDEETGRAYSSSGTTGTSRSEAACSGEGNDPQ